MLSNLTRVRTGPGKPGKSWNFILEFSRTGKSWKKATGPGKFQPRSQGLSSLPPLVVGRKTLVMAGHMTTQNLGGKNMC